MKKQVIRFVSLVLMGVLCTPINYVQASTGSSTSVSSSNSTVSDSGGSGSGTNGWKYYNDDGYKMTTYILATTELDYLNNIPNDLKKYIINSREGLRNVKNNLGVSPSKTMKKYTESVTYYGKGSQTYISDYYQQLGNGMCIQVDGIEERKPGYVAMVTSPKSHMSRFEEDGFTSSSSVDSVISRYRSEIKLEPAEEGGLSKKGSSWQLSLGNYVNTKTGSWFKVDKFSVPDEISDVQGVTGTGEFLKYAICNSMASGLYYTGVSCSELSKFGIEVRKKSNGNKVTGKTVRVTDIIHDDSVFFSMKSNEYVEFAEVKGYYLNDGKKVEVEFNCRQVDLYNAFLSRYKIDGESYTWNDLCVTGKQPDDNYGLKVSVVVVIEPIKMGYYSGMMSSSDKSKYFGKYADYDRNNSANTNGLFLTLRERAYWLGNNRGTGSDGLKSQDAWKGTSPSVIIDEKYSSGLCLNYVDGSGLSLQPNLITRLNSMMYSSSAYAEFPAVVPGGGSRCGNKKSFNYGTSKDSINPNASAISGSNTSNLVGGIACIGYYHELDLDTTSSVNPFPSLTVRHIDSTALSNSTGTSNVLMRDSVTWTLPAALGLAIEHDVARATFLSETKGLFYAYGGELDNVSYASLSAYLNKAWEGNPGIRSRFGNNAYRDDSGVDTQATSKAKKMEVFKSVIDTAKFTRNGISVSTLTFKELLKGAYENSGLSAKEFMSTMKQAQNGDTSARSKYYSWCMKTIVSYYSNYSVRIPLLRSEESNLSTKISSSNTYWAVSGKPLSSCSGVYEYYDGAIMGKQTEQTKAIADSIKALNKSTVGQWDVVESRDNEAGKFNTDVFGETNRFVTKKFEYPGVRATSPLEYYVEDGTIYKNVPENSKKSKLNFFYGTSFIMDRKVGNTYTTGDVTDLRTSVFADGSSEIDGSDQASYLPSAKIVKSYTDVMYDVSIFTNSVGFMEKSFGQTIGNLIDNATQIKKSNYKGTKSWNYLVLPELSLGNRMLMGNNCSNKIVNVSSYYGISTLNDNTKIKGEQKTVEPLMTYWLSSSYVNRKDENVRENMFFGKGSSLRAYNNVWVPDLGNNNCNLNKAELSMGDGVNGGQTATGKMFEVNEKIYGITLAYNPEMGSADSWTYRIGSGYKEEASDLNAVGENNIPVKCNVNISSGSSILPNSFADRCDALGVDGVIYEMPDSIPKVTELNSGKSKNKRNFIKYNNGWKLLNKQFDNSGVKAYSKLSTSSGAYTLDLSEGTKPNAFYVTLNVGDWICYGDLGTLDAYYDTVPAPKIFDLALDLDTDKEGAESFGIDSLLLTSDYGIKDSEITDGFTLEEFPTSYDMEKNASNRGFSVSDRRYVGTVSVKGNNIKLLNHTISNGNRCINMLRSNSVLYQLESKIVDLKAAMTALESDEVIYYINVWVTGVEEYKEIEGDAYIRSDELISAVQVTVPNNSLRIKAVADVPNCGLSGHSDSTVNGVTWNYFSAKPKNAEVLKVLGGNLVKNNPFTVLGTTKTKSFGMNWLGDSESRWRSGGSSVGDSVLLPNGLSVGVLLHRSMLDADSKEYSLTPPLAEYMQGTESNKKYSEFCESHGVPVDVYGGKGTFVLSNHYGWSAESNNRKLSFGLFDKLDIGRGGDMSYSTDYTAKYSCVDGEDSIDHEEYIIDNGYNIKGSYPGKSTKDVDVAIEGTYVASLNDNKVKEPEVYSEKYLGGTDTEILYKVPTKVRFTPTYLMRADYSIENYEVGNVAGSSFKEEGNREKVWVLGSKERTMNVYNLHSLRIVGAEETKVQAPWSTDRKDKQNYQETGKPTVKAGSAYKLSKTGVNLQVQSVVYLLDENFYTGDALDSVKEFNSKAMIAHEDLVDNVKRSLNTDYTDGGYCFIYSSLPGGYDEQVAMKYNAFKNKFTNVIQGRKMEYSDSEFATVFNKTKVKAKVNYANQSTSVICSYFNKEYDDVDYTTSDYVGNRGMKLNVCGNEFTLNPKLMNITEDVLKSDSIGEVSKAKTEALQEFYKQLHKGTKAGQTWYKEDFEGVLQVTVTTNIIAQLDSDYSIIWDNLSDWQDRVGVKPYSEAKPFEESFNGQSSVTSIGSSPNITSKIPAGEVGCGYGFLMDNVNLNGVDFGTACLMLKPYMFEVRGNVYDDVSK